MVAFAILFMFLVGIGIGAFGTAYYLQIVSPDRVRSFISHLQEARLTDDIEWGADAAQAAMRDTTEDAEPNAERTEEL